MTVPAPPTPVQMDRLRTLLAPLARVVQPHVDGIERIPDRPALFVGNHTRYSFLDLPFMMSVLWDERRLYVRGLGDHGHYAIPVWRNLLELGGMVRGTRDNVRALMREGQNVLVFPGGADEVFKKRSQDYQLLWKERVGFAKLAIECRYPIVPFAAVGAEEMMDVIVDADTPVFAQASNLLQRLAGVPLPPVPAPLPRPNRLYFWFGEPIDAEDFDDPAALRDEVRAAVEHGIALLQAKRAEDERRGLFKRLVFEERRPPLAERDPEVWFVHTAFDAWNESGPAGAAAWLSRWVVLRDREGTYRGRDAAIARITEVWEGLGAGRADVTAARSGEGDAVHLSLRIGGEHSFDARVEVNDNEIVTIEVVG